MRFEFMTREVFDTLIFAVIFIGVALAVVRLYRDFTRPLPPQPLNDFDDGDAVAPPLAELSSDSSDDDTRQPLPKS